MQDKLLVSYFKTFLSNTGEYRILNEERNFL